MRVKLERLWLFRILEYKGRKTGKEADTIPSDDSIDDQVAVSPETHVVSTDLLNSTR